MSVLFINMKLPDPAKEASEALQKSFEVVFESCTKYKGRIKEDMVGHWFPLKPTKYIAIDDSM